MLPADLKNVVFTLIPNGQVKDKLAARIIATRTSGEASLGSLRNFYR